MAEEEKKRFLDGNEMELGENQGRNFEPKPSSPRIATPLVSRKESPLPPVLSYCASSIMMTVANKYILSFPAFNLNFFLLAVQVSRSKRDIARIVTDVLGRGLRCRDLSVQNNGYHYLSGLQSGRGKEM